MTDLLGALHALQAAVAVTGAVRIEHTSIPGMSGAVEHDTTTVTIHINPNLGVDEWFSTLSEGLRIITRRGDPFGMETFAGPITADGAQVIPLVPRLKLVGDNGNS